MLVQIWYTSFKREALRDRNALFILAPGDGLEPPTDRVVNSRIGGIGELNKSTTCIACHS